MVLDSPLMPSQAAPAGRTLLIPVPVIRRPLTILAAVAVTLLLTACASLPEGVVAVRPEDPDAGVLTLPDGRSVPVRPEALGYSGDARLTRADGRTYEGSWVAGQPHGYGVQTWPDGTRYRGLWRQGQRHGAGELRQADGSRYVGRFAAGLREGLGSLTGTDGTYRGRWSGDLPNGQGTFESADGARYQGEWFAGQRFGYGRYRAADGGTYEGDWANDQPHGFGRLRDADGATYRGAWHQGQRHGYGRAEGPPELVYQGTWRHGTRHGFGREDRPDGSSYVGGWQAGKRHGEGLEVRADASFHDGAWELDQALGPGQRRASTGIEISGVWNGDTVSTGLVRLPTGLEYAGPLFSDGGRRAGAGLVSWLHGAAVRGDPYAQLMLGTFHLDMEYPARDVEQARQWLDQAARSGVAHAQFRLALTLENLNPPRVVELLAEAGRQNHPQANETLGEYYYGGITVPRNLQRAIRYFQQAVEAGSVSARNNLAWLLATAGEAAHRDGPRAVALIRPIALYSGRWQYLDTLAAACAAAGDFEAAVTAAQRAIDTASREPGPAENLDALRRRLAGYREGRAHVEPPP